LINLIVKNVYSSKNTNQMLTNYCNIQTDGIAYISLDCCLMVSAANCTTVCSACKQYVAVWCDDIDSAAICYAG